MDTLNREHMTLLASHRGWPSVSLFLPMHSLPRQQAEDRLRMKNLLGSARNRLVQEGMRAPEADAFCAQAKAVLDDDSFWREYAQGLAFFFGQGDMQVLRLDVSLPEQMVVGDRYYMRPLFSAYRSDETFWALALDKNQTRLFRGDRGGIEQVDMGDTPTSFDDYLRYEDRSRPDLAIHSITAGHTASRHASEGSSYAGHGGIKDADIGYTDGFARAVEHGVAAKLVDESAPLLVFGNERLVAGYRALNTYPQLFEHSVIGSSDFLHQRDIHKVSLEVLAPRFEEHVNSDLRDLVNHEGSSLSSHKPEVIATAAAMGRVKTLFFDEGVGPFGVLDRDSLEVKQLCEAQPRYLRENKDVPGAHDGECGWDLVDLSAAETVAHGGEIHAFTGEQTPVSGIAAVFRY